MQGHTMHGHDHDHQDDTDHIRVVTLQNSTLMYDRSNGKAWLRSSVALQVGEHT